jgi:hypothetical protein
MEDDLGMAAPRPVFGDKHLRVFGKPACSDWILQPGGRRECSPQTSRSGTQGIAEGNCWVGDTWIVIQEKFVSELQFGVKVMQVVRPIS